MITTMRGLEEVQQEIARCYFLAKLIREVRVLRAMVKDMPATATTACNICFRDYPHSGYVHEEDARCLHRLSESHFDKNGFPR